MLLALLALLAVLDLIRQESLLRRVVAEGPQVLWTRDLADRFVEDARR